MTTRELNAIARILLVLGEFGDWRQRISVAAAAIRIGIMTNPGENDWVDRIRRVCEIDPAGTEDGG